MAFYDRTAIVIGDKGMEALRTARVAVYGLGGVGAACAMDLVRAGVGFLHVVDFDVVEESNLNRLYFGYAQAVGRPKTEVFCDAAKAINPDIILDAKRVFFSGETAANAVAAACASGCSWHADCVDSLNPKAHLIGALYAAHAPFISSMGTAGRLDPSRLRIGVFTDARGCPLAKSLRGRLKRMKVPSDFAALWSDEPVVKPVPQGPSIGVDIGLDTGLDTGQNSGDSKRMYAAAQPSGRTRMLQGSTPFVPQTAGHYMAFWIVRQILADIA